MKSHRGPLKTEITPFLLKIGWRRYGRSERDDKQLCPPPPPTFLRWGCRTTGGDWTAYWPVCAVKEGSPTFSGSADGSSALGTLPTRQDSALWTCGETETGWTCEAAQWIAPDGTGEAPGGGFVTYVKPGWAMPPDCGGDTPLFVLMQCPPPSCRTHRPMS